MQSQTAKFTPTHILNVYSRADHRSRKYIELCDVLSTKKGYIPGAGKPLSKDAMRMIIQATLDDDTPIEQPFDNNFIGEHILFFIHEEYKRRIVWYRKAKKISMIFSKKLGIKQSDIWMPALLFDVNEKDLSIYALKSNTRPTLNTILYHAPIFNTVGNNKMCWGSVRREIPEGISIDQEIRYWERFMWGSEFAHPGGVSSTKTDIIKLMKSLGKSGDKFPSSELISTKIKLKDILR